MVGPGERAAGPVRQVGHSSSTVIAALATLIVASGSPTGQAGRAETVGPLVVDDLPQIRERLHDRVLEFVEDHWAGTVYVRRGDRVLIREGFRNDRLGRAATPESLYDVGSIAKQFTAAAILLLEKRHRLRLTDTIPRHLRGVDRSSRHATITIRHLLQHRSGLQSDIDWTDAERKDRDLMVLRGLDTRLQFEPGRPSSTATSATSSSPRSSSGCRAGRSTSFSNKSSSPGRHGVEWNDRRSAPRPASRHRAMGGHRRRALPRRRDRLAPTLGLPRCNGSRDQRRRPRSLDPRRVLRQGAGRQPGPPVLRTDPNDQRACRCIVRKLRLRLADLRHRLRNATPRPSGNRVRISFGTHRVAARRHHHLRCRHGRRTYWPYVFRAG